jgi:hypothetical protein
MFVIFCGQEILIFIDYNYITDIMLLHLLILFTI